MVSIEKSAANKENEPAKAPTRLVSLDAFRGFVMLCMISGGLGFQAVADKLRATGQPNSLFDSLAYQFSHVPSVGCSFWDLIQPGFFFIVGMAIPYSIANRGITVALPTKLIKRAIRRSSVLSLMGIFLSLRLIQSEPDFNWHLYNVLTQIGLGYTFVFMLAKKTLKIQLVSLFALLGGYWLLFTLWPVSNESISVSTNETSSLYQTLLSHWELNSNVALQFDRFFLNLWYRPEPYLFSKGGYQTLNFIPSIANMLIGLMLGNYLLKSPPKLNAIKVLLLSGLVCLIGGYILGQTLCPLIKRLWTPSWAIFSSGWLILGFTSFYVVSDFLRVNGWEAPLLVLGRNPIIVYVLYMLFAGPAASIFQNTLFAPWVENVYLPMVISVMNIGGLWVIAYELNRRKIYIRI